MHCYVSRLAWPQVGVGVASRLPLFLEPMLTVVMVASEEQVNLRAADPRRLGAIGRTDQLAGG
jgi:hypothetical protein